jgi:hypothetical protein
MDLSIETPPEAGAPGGPPPLRRRLWETGSRLFPDPGPGDCAEPGGRRVARRRLALAALAVGAGTVVSLLRTTGTGPLQTVFEEDAGDVLSDALDTSGAKAVFRPIAGYFTIGPRLLGEFATIFPISWAAAVLSISAALIAALLAVQVYLASGAHLTNRLARVLVAAPLLFAPAVENRMSEVYNRPVCLHFFAMYALFWVLLWTPATRRGRMAALLTVGMTGASTILIIGYLPLAAFRFAVRRTRHSAALFGLVLATTGAQIALLLTETASRAEKARFDPVWALKSYIGWAMPDSLLGFRATSGIASDANNLGVVARQNAGVIVLAWLVLLAIVGIAVLGSRLGLLRPAWLLAVVAGGHSVWLLVMMTMALGHNTQRYLMPSELLLFATLTLLLLPAPGAGWRRAGVALAAFAVFVAAVGAVNYRFTDTYRSHAPRWTDQLRAGAARCHNNPRLTAVAVRGAGPPLVSWTIIPCHELRGGKVECIQPQCQDVGRPTSLGPAREAGLRFN